MVREAAQTLWDLIVPRGRAAAAGRVPMSSASVGRRRSKPARTARAAAAPGPDSMAAAYERVTRAMLSRYGVRVRKWRSGMSGVAWQVTYQDGTVARLIEAPRPRGPMSAAVFLHEIGHHAIGFGTYKPRCLEELKAWEFSLAAMREHGLNVTEAVERRMRESMEYAVGKATRRGIKGLPSEVAAYLDATGHLSRGRVRMGPHADR
jgi:hypothetical protein